MKPRQIWADLKSGNTVLLLACLLLSGVVVAQEKVAKKDRDMPRGNARYDEKKYAEAEADYRISASKNPEKAASVFNLGNAIYRQEQRAEAKAQYQKVIAQGQSHFEKHRAFHNLGNIYMAEKNYSAAVDAYKNALKNDPTDEQTRYNYALAKKLLKDNPPPNKPDKQKQKQPDPKPEPQNNPDQNQNKGNNQKDKNDGQDKPEQKKDDGQKDPKQKPGGIPKQRLENLLKAVENEERKVQDKVGRKVEKAPPAQTEKDW